MNAARVFDTATRLPNGQVLAAAGSSPGPFLRSADLYQP
jgi:hypothetical protein